MSSKKKNLGQFMTTNYEYILQNLKLPKKAKDIIEPFVGNGHLLSFIGDHDCSISCYDIDVSSTKIKVSNKSYTVVRRDTLRDPPDYNGKFILTNPPYLARNKIEDKTLFDKYQVNDLYKCFIKEIINSDPIGGILIIPLNFWSSIRKNDIELRKLFLNKYKIVHLNIFEEQVFEDTTYTTCSFQFKLKKDDITDNNLNITIHPSKINIRTVLNESNNYIIGGNIYNLTPSSKYKISRITSKTLNKNIPI